MHLYIKHTVRQMDELKQNEKNHC